MPTFDVYNLQGTKVGTAPQPELFQTPVDEKLIHRYYVWVRTMLRATLAHTKTRGEVSGGGRKPWRQKGTGRARVGSTRSPIWRTGGIVFGPRKEQTWETRMPRAERRKAFFSALAAKSAAGSVVILEEWAPQAPKTKEAAAVMKAIPALDSKKVLHVHSKYDSNLFKSTSNLPQVTSTTIQNLNVVDVLNNDVVLMTKESLESLEKHFTPSL